MPGDRTRLSFNLARGVRASMQRMKATMLARTDADLIRRALALFDELTCLEKNDGLSFAVGSVETSSRFLLLAESETMGEDSPPEQIRVDASAEGLARIGELQTIHRLHDRAAVVHAALSCLDRILEAKRCGRSFLTIDREGVAKVVQWYELEL